MTTFAEFAATHEITLTATYKGLHSEKQKSDGKTWHSFEWACALRTAGGTYSTEFRMGLAHCKRVRSTFATKGEPRQPITLEIARALKGSDRVTISETEGYVEPTAPTVAELLYSLASDASSALNARNFEDFASEFGYDSDSRAAEKVYNACKAVAFELTRILGGAGLEALIACEE